MIYYSILPMDFIMNQPTEKYPETLEINYKGETVEAIPMGNNRYMITRLISTSPKAYLNPAFQPGNIITGN